MTNEANDQIDEGSYEVIRARLGALADDLKARADALNEQRKAAFGGVELSVIGNERVRTENNCVPCDIVMVQGRLLFGYNVFIGLKTETAVADVFSLHRFVETGDGFDVGAVSGDEAQLLEDPRFVQDFAELYRFYKTARLIRLSRNETTLLAVFQIGASVADVRVFRWRIDAQGAAHYLDNRGEREHQFPAQHDFEWTATGREHQISGAHPHISMLDQVFVETVGGDLTIKVEDNTESGLGIYTEPVDDPRQSLDDGLFEYAKVGSLIVLRITPYNEVSPRHFVYSTRARTVARIDAVGRACIELPEDHGVVFPGGYFLQDGRYKLFDGNFDDFEFETRLMSPNGEDVLYVFHHHESGEYSLFSYNLIRKEVANPLRCNGYSLFADGRMIIFQYHSDEPTRVHQMQIWQTPFVSREYAAAQPQRGGYLGKVGNADLVRGISDALSIRRMVQETEPSRRVYEDLIAAATRAIDGYHWLGHAQVGDLRSVLLELRSTAELIISEFDKVVAIRERAEQALADAVEAQAALVSSLRPDSFKDADQFMNALSRLRAQRGRLIGLRDLRYIDTERLSELEAEVAEQFEKVSDATLRFLADDAALTPVVSSLEVVLQKVADAATTVALEPLHQEVQRVHDGVTVLSEVVASLQSDDPTLRTRILERISEAFAQLNRVRATLQNRQKTLVGEEGRAEFAVQFQLFKQSVDSAITMASTPEACEEQLARLMLQLEELEARFSEFDEFLSDLTSVRDEVHEVFGQKKQQLLDERERRATNLMGAADRILGSVARRSAGFEHVDEMSGFFAADPMVQKLRDLAAKLRELGDNGKADEIESRLKKAAQDAQRGLRDKSELFEDGANVIKFGNHRFSVNTQPLELTVIPHQGTMALALTGTDFRQSVDDPEFAETASYWDQHLVSETPEVYRAEYLAYCLLQAGELTDLAHLAPLGDENDRQSPLMSLVRKYASERYDEGYERGLHDADASLILERLLTLQQSAGLLRHPAKRRCLAALGWAFLEDEDRQARLALRARSLGRLERSFGRGADAESRERLERELCDELQAFAQKHQLEGLGKHPTEFRASAAYLCAELSVDQPHFVTPMATIELLGEFNRDLEERGQRAALSEDLQSLGGDVGAQLELARAWLEAFMTTSKRNATAERVLEAACCLLTDGKLDRTSSAALTSAKVEGLLGQHPKIENGTLDLGLDEFLQRLSQFAMERVPAYRNYRALRAKIIERERERLRISEFLPKTLSSFVRNRLINEVYLPLIGDNFAKQLGAAGDAKRTDLMGLLLLISPPGYGKTTLMEYVASRLGLVFMKVNGPALGHGVTSLDPSEAPNVTARQEVDKINMALEMGNNVMLYLDDIQHTHPELLQKFISLCDAQRRIEGVWRGKTRTYDLRGKRFCVVMAGNPYTESGERFQIPDMLSNRADTYNLGDVLSGQAEAFALSYIENAITSNRVLSPLSMREQSDTYELIKRARGEEINTARLSHGYGAVELDEITATLQKLLRVQQVLLSINQQYIASASMDDRYRTEPPFKLQGSYRNMCKLAEKISPAMNDAELEALLADHYRGEAQTLTSGAEQNLLKLGELMGTLDAERAARWNDIKDAFRKERMLGGAEDDPVTRVTRQLSGVSDQLRGIRDALTTRSEAP